MNFLELQTRFKNLHLDSRTEWIAGGAQNKQALNDGYKEVFRKFINTYSGSTIMKTDKHGPLTITDGQGNLPNDFIQLAKTEDSMGVFLKITNGFFENTIPFNIISGSPYKIIFNVEPNAEVYIDYIKNITALSSDSDNTIIPESLQDSIIDFAMVEYFRQQRDWNNISASLQFAEGRLQERLDQIWHD